MRHDTSAEIPPSRFAIQVVSPVAAVSVPQAVVVIRGDNNHYTVQWAERAQPSHAPPTLDAAGGVTQLYVGDVCQLWYERPDAQGNAVATNNLGRLYFTGRGVTKDDIRARTLFEKAAAAGNKMAMNNLGTLDQAGNGSVQDDPKARQWSARAAASGNAPAMGSLAICMSTALGLRMMPRPGIGSKSLLRPVMPQG